MSLKKSAIKGVVWNSANRLGTQFIQFIIIIFLARLLTPADFGLIALLTIFKIISETLIDSGFRQAIIRDDKATFRDLTSVFYTNILISLSLYIFLFFLAPYIASFYNSQKLIWLSRVLFLSIIFNSLSLIQSANFARNIDFQSEAYSSIISTIIAGITGIALAYLGYGVWSLALYMVLQTFLKSVLLWLQSDWRPKGWISLESIKKYFKFGSNLLILGLVDKTVSNLESLLIGRVYSKSDLGYFSQARNLDSQFIQTSTIIIQSVSYPALSKIKDDKEKLKYGYKKVLKMAMFFAIPITAFIIVGSENIISVIYGQKWLPAAPYLSIWAVLGLFVSMHSIFTNIFLVLGQSRLYLKVSLLRQILRVITILIFINTSIINLLYAITITSTMFAFVYVFIGGRLISYKITEVFYDLKNIFFSSFLSGSSVYLLNYFVPDNNIFGFISKLVLMSVTYIIILFALKDDSYNEIKGLVFNQIRRLKKN